MRFQDTLRFSLELVLPERVVRALEKVEGTGTAGVSRPISHNDAASSRSRLLVEQADRDSYGGATFGTDTITLMAATLDRVVAMRPQPVEAQEIRQILDCILSVAEDGERNPERLRTKALAKLERQQTA